MYLRLAIIHLMPLVIYTSCFSSGNASKNTEEKIDFVGGYSGDDKIIVQDDNASIHSDRDAVAEYTKTVDTISLERQKVDSDLAGLAVCRVAQARAKGAVVQEGPLTVPCMRKVVNDRDRSGEELIQVNGKLVLRKKDDFKARMDEARTCLDQVNNVREKARQDYMLEGCDKQASESPK